MAGGGSNTVIARVGLDDNGFQEGVSRIQRSLKVVQSEFAAASSGLGDFGKSTEGLRLKSDTLNKQLALQSDKVAALTRSYEESVAQKGADAKATENLKIKLNYAVAELNNMQRELTETNTQLNTQSSNWYKLSQSLDKAGEKMKAVGDKMSSVGTKLSTAVTLPILGIGTAATKMAMDAVESENLFEVAMGAMAGDARKWSEETSKALGLNAFNVRKNVATYNSMLTSMGLTGQESLKMSEGLTQLSYDMASFYNLKPEEAFEKLKSGISGEAEPLKALGILVNDTTIKTYAYTNGIAKQGAELTEAQKVQARYGAIMQATKNAQGDLGRTMDSPTNKLRIMKEQAEQIGIQFGQILIPILEKLIGVIKPLMDKFQGLSKEQQETIVKIALVAAAIGPVILIIGKVVTIAGTLSSVISAVSGAMAAAGGASAVLSGALAVITGPIGIVIAAVVALIAIFVALYKNNEEFRNNVNVIWNQIKTTIGAVLEGLKAMFQAFITLASQLWNKYGDDIVKIISTAFNLISAIVTNALNVIKNVIKIVTSLIKGDWQGVWDGIKSLTVDLWNGISNIIKTAIELILSIFKLQFEVIKNLVTGVWNGIKTVTSSVWKAIETGLSATWNAIKSVATSIWNGISSFFSNLWSGITSVFNNALNGIKNTASNVWNGILGVTRSVWESIKSAIMSPINAAVNFVKEQIDKIKNFFSGLSISFPHIKLPHFSIKGEFSLAPPKVPYLGVDWYASGGIFNRPSVIGVGEAGSEAVLPIDRLDELMARAIEKVKGGNTGGGLALNIQNFINNTDKDIEQLAYELEFYRQRVAMGRGGV